MGNLELPYGCEITVIVQQGLKTYTSKLYKVNKGYSARRTKNMYTSARRTN